MRFVYLIFLTHKKISCKVTNIEYEKNVVDKMIRIYCRKKHKSKSELCVECTRIHQYAFGKLDKCPFGENKTACKDCKVHCYQKEMREKVRDIMRFSGPRMMIYYPKDFVIHILKKRL